MTALPPLAPAVPMAAGHETPGDGLVPGPVPKLEQPKEPVRLCSTQCRPPSVLPGHLAWWLWSK